MLKTAITENFLIASKFSTKLYKQSLTKLQGHSN